LAAASPDYFQDKGPIQKFSKGTVGFDLRKESRVEKHPCFFGGEVGKSKTFYTANYYNKKFVTYQ
jgi:hypothetical protein